MWSSRIAPLLLCLGLAACGFEPLYGEHGTENTAVTADLAAIRIEAIPDRIGQKMYNLLYERLTPDGKADVPKYSLRVRIRETVEELLYERDETATRANVTLRVDYELRRIEDDELIAKGTSRSTSGYDIQSVSSIYATLVSKDDARDRNARAISDDIRTRMAVALSSEAG
jgi:LPS-assembly lipoprotein